MERSWKNSYEGDDLSQVDTRTQWGEVRLMHVIFQENEVVYILTGAALKEEFPRFYKDFFNSFCSLSLVENLAKE